MTTRLSVNMNDQTTADVKELAARRQISVTEVIRRAVSVYKFIEDENAAGSTIRISRRNGEETIIVTLL
jgi:hypothetical protein